MARFGRHKDKMRKERRGKGGGECTVCAVAVVVGGESEWRGKV